MNKAIWAIAVVFGLGLLAADAFAEARDPKALVGDWDGYWTRQEAYRQARGQYRLTIKSVDDAGRVVARIESEGAELGRTPIPAVNADVTGRLEGNRLVLGRDELTVDGARMSGERRTPSNPMKIELTKKR